MNNNVTNSQMNSQPSFQWEAPVLYTEDWMKTMTGDVADADEDTPYYDIDLI